MTLDLYKRSEKGAALSSAEHDQNFDDLETAVNGKAETVHEHSADDITSGTLADALVAESNVTQHAAAILDDPTLTGTVTVPDDAFAIAKVDGLQTALDGKQPVDAELTAVAGLVSAADRLPYFTGSGTASLATFTSAARNLVDDTTTAAMLTTLGAAPSTPVAPVMVTGDLTLVSATHHGKTLEINAATSKRITCAQIGAGVRCRIHRPIIQPSPKIVPPNTTAVWLGGADQGFNRVRADGVVTVEYSNGNIPKLSGDVEWGGRPTTTDWASIADLADLQRGAGLSTAVIGDPLSGWASQGAASDDYANGTGGTQPTLTADGGLNISTSSTKKWLGGSRTAFAGTAMCITIAYRLNAYTSGEPRLLALSNASDDRVLFTSTTATNFRIIVNNPAASGTTVVANFGTGQVYRAAVIVLDRTNGLITWLTNSRNSAANVHTVSSSAPAANFPDWTSWTLSGEGHAIGDIAGSAVTDYDIFGFSILDNLDSIVTSTVVDRDFLLRMLGWARMQFPEGADG